MQTNVSKRRHTRAPLRAKVIVKAGEAVRVSFLKDVSCSGAFIETVDLPKMGEAIKLMFPVPASGKMVQTDAKVARVVEPMGDDDFTIPGIGVEFVDMPFESSVLIENYVIKIKYIYEELLLLVTMKNPDTARISQLLKKVSIDYKDFFELREKIKKTSFALGILKEPGEEDGTHSS